MHSPEFRKDCPIAIVGSSCRLPGAPNVQAFWELLRRGGCSVTQIGNERWHRERFWHPNATELGFSYTFAAGVIDDPFAFDPSVFGISPREAEQMDPQQRLLLELVWEALEDAGIAPSRLSGSQAGVFVGASSLDYGARTAADPASIDSHFMTGNTLSVIANRISYIFGLHGPSFTVDTACSSSLVALNQAVLALEHGHIDTAIVAGVNVIASPLSFIGFSRAGMLSPTGLCRPFAAKADGYVRAEGAVVLVLRALAAARADGERPRAMVVGSAVGSDGRTAGLTLPSADAQHSLLERLYRERGIDPGLLAFVEAHGTGTRVGDPAEADAIGRALGRVRTRPLPIGSVKSNIGHLEPASGLAGVLKAMLSLEHKHLPASLHLDDPNPDIRFADLNLAPAHAAIDLSGGPGPLHAGVSSFGFGGTNAHVVLRAPTAQEQAAARKSKREHAPELLVISAQGEPALRALAARYGEAIALAGAPEIAAAAAHRRDLLTHRLALPLVDAKSMAEMLAKHSRGERTTGIELARTTAQSAPIAFVYSGNGSQWAGMGRAALARNAAFREHFSEIDALYCDHAGWSLTEILAAPDLAERLKLTSVAQPLLYAVQSALTGALGGLGLRPAAVLGHSVGEIAAAEACGALTRAEAVELIFRRSQIQERARGTGLMLAMKLSATAAQAFISDNGLDGVEVAAINSPSAVTMAGPAASIEAAERIAQARRISARRVPVDYPFHSSLLSPLEAPFLASLADVSARDSAVPFVSTVTGARLDGRELSGRYWWRNIREPVRFAEGLAAAAELGCRIFLEIGPHPILTNNISDTLAATAGIAAIGSFDSRESADSSDPVLVTLARAVAHGANVDRNRVFGPRPRSRVELPLYPFQRTRFTAPLSAEAVDIWGVKPRHPLIGARLTPSATDWRTTLDAALVPYLADHKVDGEVVMPAAGFAEMALAAASDWLGEGPLSLDDFDIIQALVFSDAEAREIALRLSADTQVVEIMSRPRRGGDWLLHARGRIGRPASPDPAPAGPCGPDLIETGPDEIYDRAASLALGYGPEFRRVVHTRRDGKVMEIWLKPNPGGAGAFSVPQVLPPPVLDAAFHGLFLFADVEKRRTYLPVRIGSLRVHAPGQSVVRVICRIDSHSDRSIVGHMTLLAADDTVVAVAEHARFQAVTLRAPKADVFFRAMPVLASTDNRFDVRAALGEALADLPAPSLPGEDWLLLVAFVRSLAYRTMTELAGTSPFKREQLVAREAVSPASMPLAETLLDILAEAGLAAEAEDGWRLAAQCDLPSAEAILRTLCADHPARSAELLMAARAMADLPDMLRTGTPVAYQPALIEQFETESLLVTDGFDALSALMDRLATDAGSGLLRLVMAEPGSLAALRRLLPRIEAGQVAVAVVGLDANRLGALEVRIGAMAGLEFIDLGADREALGTRPPFDLALACGMPSLFGSERELGAAMARSLREHGALLALQPQPNPVADLLFGVTGGRFMRSDGPLLDEDGLRGFLSGAGFDVLTLRPVAVPGVLLAVAQPQPAVVRASTPPGLTAVFAPTMPLDARLATAIADTLEASGRRIAHWRAGKLRAPALGGVAIIADDKASWAQAIASIAPDTASLADIVHVPGGGHDEPSAALRARIASVAAMLEALRGANLRPRVWLVTRGIAANPVGAGFWAFGRVAINEYPEIDVRLLDLAADLDDESAATRFGMVMAAPGLETEILLDRRGLSVVRAAQGLPARTEAAPPHASARLDLAPVRSAKRLEWQPLERTPPADGEVEIEVAATGLNFRDVMYAADLLPDDILAEGFAGASIGLECAGRVVRIGRKVKGLKPGDPVTSFARGAFATHVTVPADVVLPISSAPLEAAAGIPVAFLTAWYGLIHLAKLERNEWVLIHAAAGGVGLAALQIARLRGARIVATAGSHEKRALVRLLGADMVLDSRSLRFTDDILRSIGGVDVVLNSLSGAAMEASIKALKPFGRFIELGKRDYVANTRVGLRPFRRNLTYYGVDIDQLLSGQRQLARKLTRDLSKLFARRAFTALPYRAVEADAVDDAFLLMQRAAHVGKVVVRPPRVIGQRRVASKSFVARAEGIHLVVGGTAGFGFAAARWLAARGARTIVVASRRGTLAPEVEDAAAALRARGVELIVAHVDVTRRDSVDWLIHWIVSQHGPLVGVIHAAMVLADGAMAELDHDKLARVFAPKVDGAMHLDAATRDAKLDYFVLFSSATTLIGNPGQAAYVAANGFLEGLARKRRADGLTALAVAFGPIADAGVLMRDTSTGARLARRTGRMGMPAHEALDHLGHLLGRDGRAPHEAAVVCAAFDWRLASRDLKVLQTPAFSIFKPAAAEAAGELVDVAGLLLNKTDTEASEIVTAMVARQVAQILRVPAEDIDPRRPLAEIGMDSLMGLELKMAVERRFGVDLPLMAMTSGKSLSDISGAMIEQLRPARGDEPANPAEVPSAARQGSAIIAQHGVEPLPDDGLKKMAEAVDQRLKTMTRLMR